MREPRFAVVGHVNKGKSSVVATLTEDVSVAIDPMPGTTTVCREFPMRVDGRVLYTLIDTPGFEQAAAVLDWLKQHEGDSSQRPRIVREFLAEPTHRKRYPEECELLKPIMAGAAILYVVDGSRPYSADYEAQMEILQWTGQPRMALVNRIGGQDHVATWRTALDQHFSLVRDFDAHAVRFEDRIRLLQAVRELRAEDQPAMDEAITALRAERERRVEAAALRLAMMLDDMLQLVLTQKVRQDADQAMIDTVGEKLGSQYRDQLRRMERESRTDIERIFGHGQLDRDESELAALTDGDLFHQDTWTRLGLSRRQLIGVGAGAGAAVGLWLDVATGGGSLGLGALIGGAVGGVGGWWSGNTIPKAKVMGLPMGGQQVRIGPMMNPQFAWIALDRALLHVMLVMPRAHARRDRLVLSEADDGRQGPSQSFSTEQRKRFEGCFKKLRTAGPNKDTGDVRNDLAKLIGDLLSGVAQRS